MKMTSSSIIKYVHFLLPAFLQNKIGLFFWNKRSYSEAFFWYLKASKKKYPRSEYNLGICYQEGTGVEKNLQLAFEWFLKSAEHGDMDAQYNLGIYFQKGTAGVIDMNKGTGWLIKAAEQGQPRALNRLGDMYKYGEGTDTNWDKAINYYRKSVEKGFPLAYSNLAECYFIGKGCEIDYQKAYEIIKSMPSSKKYDWIKNLNLTILKMVTKPKNKDLTDTDEMDIRSLFCRSLLDHDVSDIHHFISDKIIMITEKKTNIAEKFDFLIWIYLYGSNGVPGQYYNLECNIYILQTRSFIHVIVDDIQEYEIDLEIKNRKITGISIRPSFFSFEKERLEEFGIGLIAAKDILKKYVETKLDRELFKWISEEPLQSQMRYESATLPHLLFSYKGLKYSIFVELYGENNGTFSTKSEFETFIKYSQKEGYIPCMIQLDKESLKPCHGSLLQDAKTGNFIELS